jgi:hypothetical protein
MKPHQHKPRVVAEFGPGLNSAFLKRGLKKNEEAILIEPDAERAMMARDAILRKVREGKVPNKLSEVDAMSRIHYVPSNIVAGIGPVADEAMAHQVLGYGKYSPETGDVLPLAHSILKPGGILRTSDTQEDIGPEEVSRLHAQHGFVDPKIVSDENEISKHTYSKFGKGTRSMVVSKKPE